MAKEDKEVLTIDVKEPVILGLKPYKVKKEFTLDKLYKVGNTVMLSEGKTKEVLISNKFI